MKQNERIIIKKVKARHQGVHHSGAWKIAYADFVTSMMAFFMLMWILSVVSEEKLKSLSEYFMPTVGLGGHLGDGVRTGNIKFDKQEVVGGVSPPFILPGEQDKEDVTKSIDMRYDSISDTDALNFDILQKDLYKAIKNNKELKSSLQHIVIDQTPEGLRIQIIDDEKRKMFKTGSAEILDNLKILLVIVAKYLKYMPNYSISQIY